MLNTAHHLCALVTAMKSEQKLWAPSGHRGYGILLSALGTPGSPEQVVRGMIEASQALKQELGFFSALPTHMRMGLAAGIVHSGDEPKAFVSSFQAAREEFRAVGLRRSQVYEAIAVLMLRSRRGPVPVTRIDAERMKDIYQALKSHHWWLTGPEDLPACALLASLEASAEKIGRDTEVLYQALRGQGQNQGDTLQAAALFLVLCQSPPEDVAQRFARITEAFVAEGLHLLQADQDELALLCFLEDDPQTIVRCVQAHRDVIGSENRWLTRQVTFELGVSTAAWELAKEHPELPLVHKSKALVDLFRLIQQEAAAAG